MDEQIQKEIQTLRAAVDQLRDQIERMDKQLIKIVGDVDGSNNVPVTVNGRRRKIATSAP